MSLGNVGRFSFLGLAGVLRVWDQQATAGGRSDMPEPSTNPLPLYLREAFHQAVADYWGWERGTAEPEVSLEQRHPCSISTVCSLVMNFHQAMPEEIYQTLYNLTPRRTSWPRITRIGTAHVGSYG